MRRAILGDTYVDAQSADPNPVMAEFSGLLVLAMTAAPGRMEEFRLHASVKDRSGVTDAELDELLFQVAAYCGAPAGAAAKRALPAEQAES
jgi:4-carboxymuconolactone decarboxylase